MLAPLADGRAREVPFGATAPSIAPSTSAAILGTYISTIKAPYLTERARLTLETCGVTSWTRARTHQRHANAIITASVIISVPVARSSVLCVHARARLCDVW